MFFKILTTVTFVHNHIQCLKSKKEFKTLKRSPRTHTPFWGKMFHFDYHQGRIFVSDDSQNGAFYPRMGSKPSMLSYDSNPCLFVYFLYVEPPVLTLGTKKNCFHYDYRIIMDVSMTISILWKTEWLKIVSWKQFELIVLVSLKP